LWRHSSHGWLKEKSRPAQHGIEQRSQLVGKGGEKLILHAIGCFCGSVDSVASGSRLLSFLAQANIGDRDSVNHFCHPS